MAAHSSILTWKIPWTEEPGGLQSVGSQSVRHHGVTARTGKKTPILKVCCFDVCPPGGDLSKETETKI